MQKDMCILVNEKDEITGHSSKKDCHIWDAKQPKGLLHRAFSVFLFNEKKELLLQQRASALQLSFRGPCFSELSRERQGVEGGSSMSQLIRSRV